MQSCASLAWSVRKAGLRIKPTFNAAYTTPGWNQIIRGVRSRRQFPLPLSPVSYLVTENRRRKIRVRLKIKPSASCFSASDISFLPNPSPFIIRIRFLYLRTVLDVGEFPRLQHRSNCRKHVVHVQISAPDKDDTDEHNAYARFTVPSRLTVLSFHSNIAQQNCIFHGDFLSNAEPSQASSEKTSWCTTTRRSRIWFRIWFLPKHRLDNERKDTSAKMRSKLPTQALPSKFSFHPKNRVRPPLQKMPTCVPKEKNTRKALESTGWSQYSRRTVLALQKYFSKWRCTKSNPKSRPPLLQSRSFLFWESKSKPTQVLSTLLQNFQVLWQSASHRLKKAFSNIESDLRFQFPMLFLLSFISRVTNYVC